MSQTRLGAGSRLGLMREINPVPAPVAAPVDRQYLLERVGEAAVVQVYADGFRDLPLREKTLVWHLGQAAIAGRDVFYDQRYAHNLEMRDILEAIVTHVGQVGQVGQVEQVGHVGHVGQGGERQTLRAIEDYTKLFW